jgi:hypothetical protein
MLRSPASQRTIFYLSCACPPFYRVTSLSSFPILRGELGKPFGHTQGLIEPLKLLYGEQVIHEAVKE